jgi:ATP-binding cassette subfamily C (CFTR/MRP) protein 10
LFAFDYLSELRELELKYLRGRKYLDALCVYFWATTPVLISIFTFVTYVLLGNKLTAATVSYLTLSASGDCLLNNA